MRQLRIALLLLGLALVLGAQGLDPATLLHPGGEWPTYNGDYSGQRYSPLTQINAANVHEMTLAWISNPTARGGGGGRGALAQPGGGRGALAQAGGGRGAYGGGGRGGALAQPSKATPLEVNGILYFSAPDVAWALDARSGHELWQYVYPPNNGHRNGSRGLGMYGDWLYLVTPDNHLVSLDAKTGQLRWTVELADEALDYFSTTAPVIVHDHVIVGVGGDTLDNPGYIESRNPNTGALEWQFFTEPKPGQPGADTWSNPEAMAHGGGMPWMPGTYDPSLNLYYFGTGNPNPVHDGRDRLGANLYTCTIIALNPDTGKMAWYYQVSPHDTHDWDAVETPVLFDATVDGKPRKLLAQASRNGYFFVLDRTNGQHLVTAPYIDVNWATGLNAQGQPIENPEKEPAPDGRLVDPVSGGATNWHPVAYDPATGYLYVNAEQEYSMYYRTAEGKGEGFAGRDEGVGGGQLFTLALSTRTGQIVWKDMGGEGGLLATAGGVLFTGDSSGDMLALDPANGKVLWHSNVNAELNNGPMTYMLNGRQYLVFGVGDSLFAFTLLPRE